MAKRPTAGRLLVRVGATALTVTATLALVVTTAPLVPAAAAATAGTTAAITTRGPAAIASYSPDTATSLTVAVPAGTQPGDIVVAAVGFGTARSRKPVPLTTPAGWTLIQRTDSGATASLALFWHIAAAGETSYTWSAGMPVGGVVQAVSYVGVDPTHPVDASAGRPTGLASRSISAPPVTTTMANDALLATFFGYEQWGFATTWTAPTGYTQLGAGNDAAHVRSSTTNSLIQATAGPAAAPTASFSMIQNATVAALTALRPAPVVVINPPVITAISAGAITATGATITWTTDQPSSSQIDYGPTSGYGTSTTLDPTLVTAHSQTLAGLSASLTYHFEVKSTNATGQQAISPDGIFVTAPVVVNNPPVIIAISAGAITATGATITWTTDQPSSSQIDYGPTSGYGTSTTLDPTLVTAHSQTLAGLSASLTYHFRVKSTNATGQQTISPDGTFVTSAGAVPLIIDTDIFSDAGDGGALATGFALQLKGEANVIAIGVDTRLDRGNVATNSWRCAAAIAQFYNSGNVPIGTDMPNNGTEVNTVDFTGPCAALASPTTPAPDTAVNVFRRALASQPDGSVAFVCIGYEENLAALLASPPDSISPLSGHDLVAKKVRVLVNMGGGYPSLSGENNIVGNPGAAQAVATGWPTKIVYSGLEVGDQVHTGQTISSVHPANSPVRVAYEAFVGPNNWIYSYDQTAVYHAIRPNDTSMTEVGPGTNTINASGANTFTLGAGNEYYLQLNNATALDASLEALLDTLPPQPPPPVVTPNDTFDTNTIDPTKWTVTPNGSTVAAANQELEITHTGSSWTKGTIQSVGVYNQTGKSVQVQVKRAANNGLSGATYGETAIYLWVDSTHYAYFFIASGTLTAWVNSGSGEVNLTSNWPAYSATAMQWVRFRESGGTLYFEYAAGATAPQTWTALASLADPFPVTAVSFKIVAGSNVTTTDTAAFDNVATY